MLDSISWAQVWPMDGAEVAPAQAQEHPAMGMPMRHLSDRQGTSPPLRHQNRLREVYSWEGSGMAGG